MKKPLAFLCLAAATVFCSGQITTVQPVPSDEILFNPGMGLYHMGIPYQIPQDHWALSVANIAYIRWDWSQLNPAEGVYAFDEIIGKYCDHWHGKYGMRIAFRVMSQSMHSSRNCVTPQFVFDKGVPYVIHTALNGKEQRDPVFWDNQYLQELDTFLAALGNWLGDRKDIEFIDIGNIGEWGEMHLQRWTPEQLEATGYSHAKYVLAYRKMIDSYKKHLGRFRIFLNVGDHNNHTINDYAFLQGFHFRQDGLKHTGASYNCGKWLYTPYAPKGVLCNYEFFADLKGMNAHNWSFPGSIDLVLSEPISYLNTNVGIFRDDTPRELVEEQFTRCAKKIGYRLRPTDITYSEQSTVGGRLPIESSWLNEGLASPSLSFAIKWSLHDEKNTCVLDDIDFPVTPTTAWAINTPVTEVHSMTIPDTITPGDYTLKVMMWFPEEDIPINLALKHRDEQGRYTIGKVRLADKNSVPPVTILTENFDDGAEPWPCTLPTFQSAVLPDSGIDGTPCMQITGSKQANTWHFFSRQAVVTNTPAWSNYRFSLDVKITRLKPSSQHVRICPKFGIYDSQGKWLTNTLGAYYNMKKPGTWQHLSVTVELDKFPHNLEIALETGSYDGRWEDFEILIDNLKIEQIFTK